MSSFDRWTDSEQRRRFRGMGIALLILILALIIPVSEAPQEWVKTQLAWIAGLFLAFQFGQIVQGLRMTRARAAAQAEEFHSNTSSPPNQSLAPASGSSVSSRTPSVPVASGAEVQDTCPSNAATLSASAPSLALREKRTSEDKPVGMGLMSHQNRSYLMDDDKIEIRAYANVEEATRHGWLFGPAIAVFNGQPVPETATLGEKTYAYVGLGPNRNTGLVPPDTRLFGALSYRIQLPTQS